jgi:hypothetical protein
MKIQFLTILFSFLIVTGCKKESSFLEQKNDSEDKIFNSAKAKLKIIIKKYDLNNKIGTISKTQSSANSRASANKLNLSKIPDYNYYKSAIAKVIDPDIYQCGPTMFDDYVIGLFNGFTEDDFALLDFSGIPLDYEYVFGNTDGGQYFGSNGQFTNANISTFKNLKRFWDIPTDIVFRAAHGEIFKDVNKVASVLLLYDFTQADAILTANYLKIVFGSDKFRNYNHPILTFNAFAAPPDPGFNPVKKIVMGDGIQQAYDEMGFSDVASKQILSHEYGHHVQLAKNVDFGDSPEATRRTELMADAMSAYYLTHSRGEAMNWKRVKEFLLGFYLIGDCGFKSKGHHGTPNQRMKAAEFGKHLANDAQNQGKKFTSSQFIALFDAALPLIIAPDVN